ncbi:MAG TPA: Uma2 family endonuclease [Chloroflexota bacterium]|jgi:Uma2 family endonuclease|nr:Uma2 family endonuclease [Chloroflexota bacterium]
MAVQLPRWRFTVDEFERMIEAGVFKEDDRVELIDGEVVQMAALGWPHAESVMNCTEEFSIRARGLAVVNVQNPLDLRPHARPEPDLALLRPPRSRYRRNPPRAEDVLLVVEVADSSLATDRDVKIPMYARAGIPEAWLVNLVDDVIRIYREPTETGYRVIQTARRGETLSPLAFPDWAIPVDELLPAAP